MDDGNNVPYDYVGALKIKIQNWNEWLENIVKKDVNLFITALGATFVVQWALWFLPPAFACIVGFCFIGLRLVRK